MKKCSCCGRDNADDAMNCHECGTEFEAEAAAVDKRQRAGRSPKPRGIFFFGFPKPATAFSELH
jgi:hypothetical protein